ncbi:unnamed protein product [Anisakis simplex]|nr:unnamed protein product [Anisakis simplex]
MAEREVRSIVFGAFLSHPIAVVSRTLSQLGYNRLPLTKGRYFLLVGPSCFFHANAFSYARHLYQLYGFRSLWVGAEIALVKEVLACAIRLIVARVRERIPDQYVHILSRSCKAEIYLLKSN